MRPGTHATSEPRRGAALSAEDIASYREHGYLAIHGVAPRDELAAIDRDMDALWRARSQEPGLSVEDLNNTHGLGDDHPVGARLSRDARVLDIVEALIGPDILLWAAKVISKPPRDPRMVCHWHQDEAYWEGIVPSERRMSLWIPLQDVDESNGCLRVVPGSHRRGVLPHEPRSARPRGACRLAFADAEAEPAGMRTLPLPLGSVIAFSSRLQHSSLANATDAHRRAFIISYLEPRPGDARADRFPVLRSGARER